MSTKTKSAASAVTEPKFTKQALLNSKRFHNEYDLVSALLKDDGEYTIAEVENKIEKFLKGKVK